MHWSSNDFSFGTPPPTPSLWTDTQTGVKTLPSRRTTYAGGNNFMSEIEKTVISRQIY